jgi:hypothetical protein
VEDILMHLPHHIWMRLFSQNRSENQPPQRCHIAPPISVLLYISDRLREGMKSTA